MFFKCLNSLIRGFFPAALALPHNAILPEQVLQHRRSERRGSTERQHCPLLHLTCAVYSYHDKSNSPEPLLREFKSARSFC
jgi:hypothetical protein